MSTSAPIKGFLNPVVHTTDAPMFSVVGTRLQFVSTPEQNGSNISVMRAGLPARAVVPIHSHAEPEIFYVIEGTMEVYQNDCTSSGWQTAGPGDVVTIAGGVRHALRNPTSDRVTTVLVSEERLQRFFQELADPLEPATFPPAPTPEVMQRLLEVSASYQYWIGSAADNAMIGIDLA